MDSNRSCRFFLDWLVRKMALLDSAAPYRVPTAGQRRRSHCIAIVRGRCDTASAEVSSDGFARAPNYMSTEELGGHFHAGPAVTGAALMFAAAAVPALASGGLPDLAHLSATAALGAALVALTSFDLTTFRLPDVLTLSLLAAGLLVAMLPPPHLLDSLLGASAGYGLLWSVSTVYLWIRGHAGLGLGDAKLMAAAGAWLGVEALPTVLLMASVLGLSGAILLQVCGAKLNARTRLAFGPFLALSFWLVWLYGARLNWFGLPLGDFGLR